MLRRTRSQTKLCSSSPRRRSRRELEDESEGKENLPTPPSTPKRKKTDSPPQTPQNIRHITKELEKTQVSNPALKKDETPPTPTKEIPKANQESNAQEKQQIPITARAKALFSRTAIPSRLVARDNERQTMTDFWQTHVIGNQPGSLYVSGSPGTGKTAMLLDIMRKSQDELDNLSTHKVQTVMINCMSVGEPKQIYAKLVTELKGPKTALSNDPVQHAHQLLLAKKNTLSVVVLDEIDHLITKDQDVLYRLFEWASQPESRLVLIGIANALDLTDRLLPRLRAKGCEPCLLNFSPYTVKEVTEIIQDRLYSLVDAKDRTGELPLMHQKAVELCARKVAAGMGDLRTALDMCRQAIELAEAEYNKKAVLTDQSSNGAREAPRVTIVHMSKAQRSMFGNPTIMKLKQLNLQQKAALVVLIVMSRTGKKDTITLGKFREQHTTLWKKFEGIPSLSHTELNDVLAMIEANGFITVGNSREERTRRIHLNIQESEVLQMAREIEVLNLWVNEILQE